MMIQLMQSRDAFIDDQVHQLTSRLNKHTFVAKTNGLTLMLCTQYSTSSDGITTVVFSWFPKLQIYPRPRSDIRVQMLQLIAQPIDQTKDLSFFLVDDLCRLVDEFIEPEYRLIDPSTRQPTDVHTLSDGILAKVRTNDQIIINTPNQRSDYN